MAKARELGMRGSPPADGIELGVVKPFLIYDELIRVDQAFSEPQEVVAVEFP